MCCVGRAREGGREGSFHFLLLLLLLRYVKLVLDTLCASRK